VRNGRRIKFKPREIVHLSTILGVLKVQLLKIVGHSQASSALFQYFSCN
jgi:hypothetical protein